MPHSITQPLTKRTRMRPLTRHITKGFDCRCCVLCGAMILHLYFAAPGPFAISGISIFQIVIWVKSVVSSVRPFGESAVE